MSGDAVVIRAYAKINLGLRVLRKRADGYHDIETVFHRVEPFDEITLSPASVLSMTCSSAGLPTDESNLCVRAAIAMAGERPRGAAIGLRKSIPVGAGLGGGSSDAAAVLLGLNQMWGLGLGLDELARIALRLGSDVPYFLGNGSAHAEGRGERLRYFNLKLPWWIVVVFPGIHLPTAEAYRAVAPGEDAGEPLRDILERHAGSAGMLREQIRNDFEPWAIARHPVIGMLKDELYARGAGFAQMSGSGSAVYGLFAAEAEARAAAGAFSGMYQAFLTPPGV